MKTLLATYLEAVGRLNRRLTLAEGERDVAWELVATLREDIADLEAENEALHARAAVLADLADPQARALAAAVLKTIERL